jgi:hypothetical protein
MTDSTNSCPFLVNRYSTLGGISLYALLSNIPDLWRSFNLAAIVLLLIPFSVCLNFKYLTGSVVQQSGIRISSVPLFVISDFCSFFHKRERIISIEVAILFETR